MVANGELFWVVLCGVLCGNYWSMWCLIAFSICVVVLFHEGDGMVFFLIFFFWFLMNNDETCHNLPKSMDYDQIIEGWHGNDWVNLTGHSCKLGWITSWFGDKASKNWIWKLQVINQVRHIFRVLIYNPFHFRHPKDQIKTWTGSQNLFFWKSFY